MSEINTTKVIVLILLFMFFQVNGCETLSTTDAGSVRVFGGKSLELREPRLH